ncbi:MAG: hypothetical protein MI784_11050 [Cytophagales bacterium]|nr:hypothetical protein [Cytophagales bacterium]
MHKADFSGAEKPIQAKIGFEFQSAEWMICKSPACSVEAGATQEEVRAASLYKKGHVLFENAFWSAQVDTTENRVSYLELVTAPFEEDGEGFRQFKSAASEMVEFFDFAFQAPHKATLSKRIIPCRTFSRFGGIKSPEALIVLPKDNPNPVLIPQATAGIRLDKLYQIMSDISAPSNSEPESEASRKEAGRIYLLGDSASGDFLRGASKNARIAVRDADVVVRRFQEKWHMPFSDALKGLLTLVLFYLFAGFRGSKVYAKASMALLARTDFARMFSLLPENEKEFLAANGGSAWLELVKSSVPEGMRDFSQSFFSGGIFNARPEIFWHTLKDLSKEQWLTEMTRGRDLLTERHFPNRRRAYELESMGAMGDKTDTVLGEPAPIIEFRAGKKCMDARQAMDYAEKTFKAIYALNRGLDHYYGEPLEIR